MVDPTLDIDCHYLRNMTNSTIEPFDNTLFELGLGSYMAQGFSLSSSAVKSLELIMIPLSFMLAGCDLDNMNRSWRAVWRDFHKCAALAGVTGVSVYAWIIASAGNKYKEYLELLDCDIGVPDSNMIKEFDSASLITQILMTLILLHLCTTSFKSVFRKLPFNRCRRLSASAPHRPAPSVETTELSLSNRHKAASSRQTNRPGYHEIKNQVNDQPL